MDARGIPALCGTSPGSAIKKAGNAIAAAGNALPAGQRSWETIPAVVRNDGTNTFVLEVNCNGAVSNVLLLNSWPWILPSSPNSFMNLRDDGLSGDRLAGDHIFTTPPLRANTNILRDLLGTNLFFQRDSNSPPGLVYLGVGEVQVIELNGETNRFLVYPDVGVLDIQIPAVSSLTLSTNVQAAPHLMNVKTAGTIVQTTLRGGEFLLPNLAQAVYKVLPDSFDFLMCFSSMHVENLPRTASANFVSGVHVAVKVAFTGTGQSPFDSTSSFGSAGRLQAVNCLDANARGVTAQNATHEIMHEWSAFISMSLGLNADGAHYSPYSSVGSIVGGQLWNTNGQGQFTMNCQEGRSGAHHAPPLDKYMMGLVSGGTVAPLHAYDTSRPGPFSICDQVISNINVTVTISNIQNLHGIRSPGPSTAQRDFSLGFVIESRERFLSPTEMTFYEILAAWYAKPIPPEAPDPYVESNWVPIGRFFGEGTTWSSHLEPLVRPRINSFRQLQNGYFQLSGTGFPAQIYRAEVSTNLTAWTTLMSVVASTNGAITLLEPPNPADGGTFYRLVY
jgi:hypothetical protein